MSAFILMLLAMYGLFQTSPVQTYLVQLITNRLSKQFNTTISIQGVDIRFFNKLVLKKVLVEDQQHDSLLYVDAFIAEVDSFSLKRKFVALSRLEFDKAQVFVSIDTAGVANYQFLLDAVSSGETKKDSSTFRLTCSKFAFNDAKVVYAFSDQDTRKIIDLEDIGIEVSGIELGPKRTAFCLNAMTLNDSKDFRIDSLSAHFIAQNDSIELKNIRLKTAFSTIDSASLIIDRSGLDSVPDFKKVKLDLNLAQSQISLKDISQFVPAIKGMDQVLKLKGRIYGAMSDLKGRDVELSMGDKTRLNFDFYLNGLPDIRTTYMHLDLKTSYTDIRDLEKVKLPNSSPVQYLEVPEMFEKAGIIEYNGNFTGFLNDFVAYGTFKSRLGTLKTDLLINSLNNKILVYGGHLKTVNFKLGELLGQKDVGTITFNGNVKGEINQGTQDFMAKVDGKVDSVKLMQYSYKDISLNGKFEDEKFDGSLNINDKNLQLAFNGKLDFNTDVPVFDFDMHVDKADFKALKLNQSDSVSAATFSLHANFAGTNIDNVQGWIRFDNGRYWNQNGEMVFDNFELSTFDEDEPVLQINSDFLDAELRGDYHIYDLPNAIKKVIVHYLPASGMTYDKKRTRNNFAFWAHVKNVDQLTRVFFPGLVIHPGEIEGEVDLARDYVNLTGDFPYIEYNSTIFHDVKLSLASNGELQFRNRIGNIELPNQFRIYNISLLSDIENDRVDSKLVWNNFSEKSYSGSVNVLTTFKKEKNRLPHVDLAVKPTRIYIADSLWTMNSGTISIDSTEITVKNIKLANKNQYLMFDGAVSKDQSKKLNLLFNHLSLTNLNAVFSEDLGIEGEVNGSVSFFDLYEQPLFLANLKLDNLIYSGQALGDASLVTRWDRNAEKIFAEVSMTKDNHRTMYVDGSYNPKKDSIDFNANFEHFSLLALQPVLDGTFTNIRGNASGKVRIYGHPDHIKHDGGLYAENAGLTIPAIQVAYSFSDTVKFADDVMIFEKIRFQDMYGNTGVFDGTIKHKDFSGMVYNLTMTSPRILAINTTSADNEQFYGQAFASGVLRITGKGADVYLNGNCRSERGTDLNIWLEYEETAEEVDFLRFVKRSIIPGLELEEKEQDYSSSNLTMNFDVEVTPEARMQLIYNSKVGDVIKAQGSGNLQIAIDKNFNISMYGDYTVEQGDYLFTLQNIINKKFEIERGGTIGWNGDPYDAILNLNAIYRLKAPLSELFGSSADYIDASQRIPVWCKIALTKNLSNPDIKFDIELPTAEDRVRDVVRQYISTEEDMNKQILSLLVLGQFYMPEYLRGSYVATSSNLVGTTASELMSNNISNWLSQISKDFDFGVNYRPGNQLTDDEVELALSTQIFNDRVTINGNIGNNSSQVSTNNNSDLVGDFDINVKLTKNGKLQLKAYNHANNNLIYETSPYTQGVGVSFREDFDTFEELWKKVKNLFRSRK